MTAHALALVALLALAGCAAPAGRDDPSASGGFSGTSVFPGAYDTSGSHARVLEPGPFAIASERVVHLESALDDTRIEVAFALPDVPDGMRVPIILHASTYMPPLREGHLRESAANTDHGFLIDNFVPHGYAVAFVAVRGSGGSGGCQDVLSATERHDLDQAVTWLATQPWSAGRVGMIGLSYDGNNAWQVAAAGNPHLVTLVASASWPDLYELVVRNGTPSAVGTFGVPFFFPLFSQSGTFFTFFDQREPYEREPPEDPRDCAHLAEAFRAAALAVAQGGPQERGYWDERDLQPLVEANYRGSALVTTGLRDDFIPPHASHPWVGALSERIVVKQLLGQWGHSHPDAQALAAARPAAPNPTPRWDWAEILLRWFDHHLKEEPRDLGPRVQVADSSGAWRDDEAWPPRDARERVLHLAPARLDDAPASTQTHVRVHADPARAVWPGAEACHFARESPECAQARAAAETCMGCQRFESDARATPLRFAGLPQLHVTAVPSGPGGRLTAHLYVVGETGAHLLTQGQMDLRYADGGREPRDVRPGEPVLARMELEPTDALVRPGERLVLVVGQGGYGHPASSYYGSGASAPIDLRLGDGASVLRVLAFERADDALFDAPG
ncbi:MAG TPA: CocE/NonD family hydrolase [Candidatus Thermoplasmatota archaeon]|nr:CocE/NonD family hydrolase [Candidatus Thermoplasmatota archaeon]